MWSINATHGPMLDDRYGAEADDNSYHPGTDEIDKHELAADVGVVPVDDADAGVATACAGDAGVVPTNTANAGTALVNTADAGATLVNTADAGATLINAKYPRVTHISTATQMKAPEVAVPAKIPGGVRKTNRPLFDMDEQCSEEQHKYQLQ